MIGAGGLLMRQEASAIQFTSACFVPPACDKDNVIGGAQDGPQICPQHRL
jgi:hypothetical protein